MKLTGNSDLRLSLQRRRHIEQHPVFMYAPDGAAKIRKPASQPLWAQKGEKKVGVCFRLRFPATIRTPEAERWPARRVVAPRVKVGYAASLSALCGRRGRADFPRALSEGPPSGVPFSPRRHARTQVARGEGKPYKKTCPQSENASVLSKAPRRTDIPRLAWPSQR